MILNSQLNLTDYPFGLNFTDNPSALEDPSGLNVTEDPSALEDPSGLNATSVLESEKDIFSEEEYYDFTREEHIKFQRRKEEGLMRDMHYGLNTFVATLHLMRRLYITLQHCRVYYL